MAYKAPKGLSSAIKGRSMVRRDYGSQIKFDAYQREAKKGKARAGLGMVQGIAGGVAQLSSAVGKNIGSWEELEAGEKTIWESSPEAKVEGAAFKSSYGEVTDWDKITGMAPTGEVVKIGDKGYITEQLRQVGAMPDASSELLRTGGKTLHESLGASLVEAYSDAEGGVLEKKEGEQFFKDPYGFGAINPQASITQDVQGSEKANTFSEFQSAFREARKGGLKEFYFNNQLYNTELLNQSRALTSNVGETT